MKNLNIIGGTTFAALFLLSLYFFKERVALFDMAIHTFTILKTKAYFIQNGRFAAFFTQTFPLIAGKLGLPLKIVMLLYSMSFFLLYGGVFWILSKVLNNEVWATVVLLFFTLFSTHTFFWAQSELPQGFAFLILLFGLITTYDTAEKSGAAVLTFAFFLCYLVVYAHPLLLFPFVYGVGYIFLKNNWNFRKNPMLLSISFFAALILFFKYSVLPQPEYDSNAMAGFNIGGLSIKAVLNSKATHYFFSNFIGWYMMLPLVLLITIGYQLFLRHYFQLIWLLLFFFGYLTLIGAVYSYSEDGFYLENLYLPIGFFVALPFADLLHSNLNKNKLIPVALSLICIFALSRVVFASTEWTARLNWQSEFLADNKGKIILHQEDVPMDLIKMSWASSYEFLLLSSLDGPQGSRYCIIDENPDRFSWTKDDPNVFITEWETWKTEELPGHYFGAKPNEAYSFKK